MQTKSAIIFSIICFVTITGTAIPGYSLDKNTGYILADDKGNIIYNQNDSHSFIPASILKILTSLVAIDLLGEDFRFPTAYSYDNVTNNLYIKGFGDPLFISEAAEIFCKKIIARLKIKLINNIIIDQSYFDSNISIPGTGKSTNPYDAPVGALCANFNTVMFRWDIRSNRFISAEAQTPLLNILHEDIKKTHLKEGRIILSQKQSKLYAGQLMAAFLKGKGVKINGIVKTGRFKSNPGKTFTFTSPIELKSIIEKLLKYSNNFIANQLVLTMGAQEFQAPATLNKGVSVVKKYASNKLGLPGIRIVEGSGISRLNRISPEQMINILLNFMSYHTLLNHKKHEFYKTGTLEGIRTRAGYIHGDNNRLYPFVIMVNKKNTGYQSIQNKMFDTVHQLKKK